MNKQLSLPETFLRSPTVQIFCFFLNNKESDYSKEEVLRNLKMSRTTFYKYFFILEDKNLIRITKKVGKAKMYKLNKDSLAAKN